MATSYTSLLGLALPVTSELDGTWGDTVNNSITSLLDTAVAGTTTLSTDADVTLTTTTGASNQARQAILLCSGARTVLRTITAPAQSKIYVVINNTTGGFGVKLVGAGPTTGVTVANGRTAVLVWNGSDFVEVAPATATTATNLAGGSAGSLPYQSGAGLTTFLSIGTNNFVLTSNGTAPVWTTNTGTGNVVRATSPTLVTPLLGTPTSGTLTNCTGLPISTGVSGLGAGVATFLATPSSANLASAVTDETGSGALVFANTPTLVTPVIGAATGTSLSLTGGGLTARSAATQDAVIIAGRAGGTSSFGVTITPTTLTASRTVTLADGNTTLQAGTMAVTGSGLNQFAATTSAQLAGVISDETGSGSLVFATSPTLVTPTITTSSTVPLLIGGTGVASTLTLRATSGVGTTGSDIIFQVGNNGTTEAMRILNGGNVGIGTASPNFRLSLGANTALQQTAIYLQPQNVAGADNEQRISNGRIASIYSSICLGFSDLGSGVADRSYIAFRTYQGAAAIIQTSGEYGVERMRISPSGNVGIGTTTPSTLLSTSGTITSNAPTGQAGGVVFSVNGTALGFVGSTSDATTLDSRGTVPLTFQTNSLERMRLDANGNLLLGTTTSGIPGAIGAPRLSVDVSSYNGVTFNNLGSGNVALGTKPSGAHSYYAGFFVNSSNTPVGDITCSTTGTTYNTTSDYRLKYNITSMKSGLSRIVSLNPVTYKWNVDNSAGEGFIAHELQEVIPMAVTGQKDATNSDGAIKPQSVDYSKIVVHLVSAIKELKEELDSLKSSLRATNL